MADAANGDGEDNAKKKKKRKAKTRKRSKDEKSRKRDGKQCAIGRLAARQAEQLGGHGHIIINHISLSLRFSVSLRIDNQQGVGERGGRGTKLPGHSKAHALQAEERAKLAKRNEVRKQV